MPWGVAAGAAIAAGGAYMQSESAKDAANTQSSNLRNLSAEQYARAQEAAGRYNQFRPVTVTSNFGTPTYTYNDKGELTGVSSTAAPWLSSLQTAGQGNAADYMALQQAALKNTAGYNASNRAFTAGQSLYDIAGKALPTSYDTTQATQDYYNQMQGLVAPQREQQLASTRNNLFQKGRQGLAVGATQAGGMAATNPEMAAYYNAVAQQDANLAMQSKQQSLADLQARQNMGLGLFAAGGQQTAIGGTALGQYYGNIGAAQSPFTNNMAQLSGMETMQNQPITQGMQYGANVTNQGNTIADAYMRAAGAGANYSQAAINAQAAADAQNPWAGVLIGAGQAIGGANWGSVFNSPTTSSGTSSFNQAASNYGSGTQQFGAPASGWSYGGFSNSGRLY